MTHWLKRQDLSRLGTGWWGHRVKKMTVFFSMLFWVPNLFLLFLLIKCILSTSLLLFLFSQCLLLVLGHLNRFYNLYFYKTFWTDRLWTAQVGICRDTFQLCVQPWSLRPSRDALGWIYALFSLLVMVTRDPWFTQKVGALSISLSIAVVLSQVIPKIKKTPFWVLLEFLRDVQAINMLILIWFKTEEKKRALSLYCQHKGSFLIWGSFLKHQIRGGLSSVLECTLFSKLCMIFMWAVVGADGAMIVTWLTMFVYFIQFIVCSRTLAGREARVGKKSTSLPLSEINR